MEANEVVRKLESDKECGLSTKEGEKRRLEYGLNEMDKPRDKSLLLRILAQLKDPMILLLLVAGGLSIFISGGEDVLDACIILVIVLVNTCISISQEDNAQKALKALEEMSSPAANVLRDGKIQQMEAKLLVPGEVILLEAGDYVPADARILQDSQLQTDESAMTGESLPVEKRADITLPSNTALGDRSNMLIAGTVVTAGRAVAIVTETGMQTQMGQIAKLIMKEEGGKTPLQEKMGEISKSLSFACLCICAVLFGVGVWQHRPMFDMLMMAVSLAVAAIPEGLSAVVTIVLALGVQRMAKQNVIIKKLPAVETLGCANVICSDKTGTLTQNKMTVVEHYPADQFKQMMTLAVLCNHTRVEYNSNKKPVFIGEATERAFVEKAHEHDIFKTQLDRETPLIAENAFDSTRKRMSTLHKQGDGKYILAVKGAPEEVLKRCTYVATTQGVISLSKSERQRIQSVNSQMAHRALRVLAVAYRVFSVRPNHLEEEELVFVGLAGMIDPPRQEVKKAVMQCIHAGIKPVMITGDHKDTAVAIAKKLNIFQTGDIAITGDGLDMLSQAMLEEEIEKISVYARVSPEHKMRIIKAWQAKKQVVAMTGDGVNDAPALKAADIGCAMGVTGTDVAKGAADMILMDDDFSRAVSAVEEGRGIYANIKKSVHYLLSCNIGEVMTVFVATLFRFPQLPLNPVQLLWLNLVTDSLPALALGMERTEHSVMEDKPRKTEEHFFNRTFSVRLAWQGVMVGALTLLAYCYGYYWVEDGEVANTMAFATLTLCQLFHAYDVRSESQSIWKVGLFTNKAMNKAFVVGIILQLSVLLVPQLQMIFSVVFLDMSEWIVVAILAIAPIPICECAKWFNRIQEKTKKRPA